MSARFGSWRYEDAAEVAETTGWPLTHRIEPDLFAPRWRVMWIVEEPAGEPA